MLLKSAVQETRIAATPHLTLHAWSMCHITIIKNAPTHPHTQKHDELVAKGAFLWLTDKKFVSA